MKFSLDPRKWFRGDDAPDPDYPPDAAPGPSTGVIDRMDDEGEPWRGPFGEDLADAETERKMKERFRAGPSGVVFPWFLPYYDDTQEAETQAQRRAYRMMAKSDPHVSAALEGLIAGVSSLDLTMIPADRRDGGAQAQSKFVRWCLEERLFEGVHGLCRGILYGALVDGYSLCSKVWTCQDRGEYQGLWPLRQLKPVNVDYEAVLQTDSHLNIVGVMGLQYNGGLTFSPNEFVISRCRPTYNRPTGTSCLRPVYKDWWFLQTIKTLRAMGCENRAFPFVWANWRTESQQQKLEKILKAMKGRGYAALPPDVVLNALEISGGSEEHFRSACEFYSENIVLGIQHATLQMLSGDTGVQRGSSAVHKSQPDLVKWALARVVETACNDHDTGLIPDVVNLNFRDVRGYPRLVLSSVDIQEMLAEADLDKKLQELGLKLGKDDAYVRYGRTPPESEDDVLEPAAKEPQQHQVSLNGGGLPGMNPGKPPQVPEPEPVGGGVKHAL